MRVNITANQTGERTTVAGSNVRARVNRVKRDAFVPESEVIMHTDTMAKKTWVGR